MAERMAMKVEHVVCNRNIFHAVEFQIVEPFPLSTDAFEIPNGTNLSAFSILSETTIANEQFRYRNSMQFSTVAFVVEVELLL